MTTSGGSSGGSATPLRPAWIRVTPGSGPVARVSPIALRVWTSDGHGMASVRWWGGSPVCTALRSADAARDGSVIRLHVAEGAKHTAVACPEIALLKATRIDLGPLPPGDYTVVAGSHRALLRVG
jgi:hypothetical protein